MNHARNHPSSLIIACGLALLALPAMLAGDTEAKFKSLDTDGDGRISRTEHAAGALKAFAQLDANRDGMVTATEMGVPIGQKPGAPGMSSFADASSSGVSATDRFKALDADGDGKLTAAEHAAGSDATFARLDADSDGFLSQGELAAGHDKAKKDK